jgi:hypothetical protein
MKPRPARRSPRPTRRTRRRSGLLLTGSVSWALDLAARIAEDDASLAASRLGLVAALLRDAAAAAVDPEGAAVVHRERFADLQKLGKVDASVLLDAAEKALRLAADLDGSRLNVRLAAEAFALGLATGGAVSDVRTRG